MKRAFILGLGLLLIAVLLAGCEPNVEVDSPEAGKGIGDTTDEAESAQAPATPMPATGPGEAAALAALPAVTDQAEKLSSVIWPDLDGAEPLFTAYLVAVDMGGQTALFEVRADGVAHGLYAYQKAFDAGTLVWTPSDQTRAPRTQPSSDGERAAVAAVEGAMRDSFPDGAFTAGVYGYRFEYVKADAVLMIVEVATDGTLISSGI